MNGKTNRRQSRWAAKPRRLRGRFRAGQAMIEFALVGGLLVLILLMGIQLAIIGEAALAVNQLAYSTARYASVKYSDGKLSTPGTDPSVTAMIPPSLVASSLTIALTQPCAAPVGSSTVFGSVAIVSVQYDLSTSNRIFLPNPFLGISLPTSVSATQRAFCE